MIRRPPRSTLSSSSAASDVYKRQLLGREFRVEGLHEDAVVVKLVAADGSEDLQDPFGRRGGAVPELGVEANLCLLYTSDAADEEDSVDLGGRRIIKKKKKKKQIIR